MDTPIDYGLEFNDPLSQPADPFRMAGQEQNPALSMDQIMNIWEKQFDEYGALEIHEMLNNFPPEPPLPPAPGPLDLPDILDPQEWIRQDQLGHSMENPPVPEAGTNDQIHAPEYPTGAVPYGRSKPSFGRKPWTFFERMMDRIRIARPFPIDDKIEEVKWEDVPEEGEEENEENKENSE